MQRATNEWTIPYTPNSGDQTKFHMDRYKVTFRLLSGGTGAGKTIAGVFEMLSWLLENPGSVGYIFEPTYRMVPRILRETLNILLGTPFYTNPITRAYSKTEHHLWFKNGSQLWFGGLDDPEMAEGPNIDVIQVDEARLIHHFDVAWRVIQRRIRGSVPGKYPTGAWITTTPNAPGSDLHQFFEDPKTKDPESKVYRISIYDNKAHLPARYIENIERTHHGGLAERFVHGRFAAVGAGTVPFDYTKHVLREIDRSILKKVCYGVDLGWDNPSCILVVAFDRDDRAYVLEEYYERRKTPEQVFAAAQGLAAHYGYAPFYIDPTAKQTIEGWKTKGLDARKNEPKRDEGIREMAGHFKVAGDGKPRIYIDASCVNLIAELQVYDETLKENDHAVDALRYALGWKIKKPGAVDAWVLG